MLMILPSIEIRFCTCGLYVDASVASSNKEVRTGEVFWMTASCVISSLPTDNVAVLFCAQVPNSEHPAVETLTFTLLLLSDSEITPALVVLICIAAAMRFHVPTVPVVPRTPALIAAVLPIST